MLKLKVCCVGDVEDGWRWHVPVTGLRKKGSYFLVEKEGKGICCGVLF